MPLFLSAQNYDCRTPLLLTECTGDSINARGGLAGATEFCEGQEVSFLNNSTGTIDSTAYCWGDGRVSLVRGAAGAVHTYDFGSDTCLAANRPRTLEVVMVAFRTCANGITSSYIKTPVRILVKPKVIFSFPQPVCAATDFSFINATCTNAPAAEVSYLWDFGDGTTSTSSAASIMHRYNQQGNYIVSLTVTNRCGPKKSTQTVTVIGLPKAKAEVLDGTQNRISPYIVCGGNFVTVTGINSVNSSSYIWSSVPATINFFPRKDTTVPRLLFNLPGDYTVILKTNNACDKPSFDTLRFRVLSSAGLALPAQTDACTPTVYRITTPVIGATYERFLDGTTQGTFDPAVGFIAGFGTHVVVAKLQNECGNQEQRDTFSIVSADPVFFLLPTTDTTVCRNSSLIFLKVDPLGGTITPSANIVRRVDSLFFNPSVSGVFTLNYRRGAGVCLREASRKITVVDAVPLVITPQDDACLPFLYKPNPIVANANYTINGVAFDPNAGFTLSQNTSYIVEARLQTPCGLLTKRDSFDVFAAADVSFKKPIADTTVCLNSGLLFLDVVPIGGTITPATRIVRRGDSLFFDPSVSGVFPLVYGRGVGVCRREASRTITVLAAARLSINEQVSKCQSFLFKPTPIINGATYTFNGVFFDPNVGIQAPVSPTQHQVVAALTNLCGSDTQRISFSVTGVVALQLRSRDTTICRQGGKITLSATSSGGSGRWSTTSAGLTGITFDPSVSGVGTHVLTFSDGVGECANSQSITIKVGGLATIDAGRDIVLCNTRQVAPFPLPIGQPAGGVFKLNNPFSGQIINQIDPAVFPTSAKVFYVITDSLCTSYDSLAITINSISTTNLNAPTAACVGIPVSFGAGQAATGLSFRIFINDTLKSTTQPFNYTFNHAGTMRLSLEIRNAAGCLDTVRRDISVKYSPKPTFSVLPNPICHGQNATIRNDTTRNDTSTTYAWIFRNQSFAQNQIGLLSMSNIGCTDSTYKLQLTATTGVCPAVLIDNNLTVLPKIKAFAAVQGPDTVCANGLVRFVNASCGRLTRQTWRIDNQTFTTPLPPDQRFENNTDTLRIVNLQLIVGGDCGSDTTAFRLWIYPLNIKARFAFNKRVSCQPFTVNFRSLTPYSAGLLWDFGDGTTSNAPSVSKTYDSAGVFKVRFRVFHPCGGFDDFLDSITVLASPKTNGLTYEKPNPCRENQIRIKPNILLGTLGRVWVDSLNLSDSTRNPILIFPKAGNFWVKYSVIHPTTGCERIDSGLVIVRTPLQLLATAKADSCGDATGAVLLNAVGGSGIYRFAKDDSTALVRTAIFNNLLGQKNYTFFVRDSATGCSLSASVFISGRPPLSINGGGDAILQLGDSLRRKAVANFLIRQIEWRVIGKTSDSSIRSPRSTETVLMPLFATRYLVIGSDSTGCTALDSFQIFIRALKSVNLADAFSPNSDGANDWFFPQTSKDVVQIKTFRVFNRWGEMVFERLNFEGNRPELGWNGIFKDALQPAEVYAWTLEAAFMDKTSTPEPLKGSVILVR
jgi:gliding motility-associated-like protein